MENTETTQMPSDDGAGRDLSQGEIEQLAADIASKARAQGATSVKIQLVDDDVSDEIAQLAADIMAGRGQAGNPMDAGSFASVDELLDLERQELEGEWQECPLFPPGNRFLVAHSSAAVPVAQELERKYRAKKRLGPNEETGDNVKIELFHQACFGTALKRWENVPGAGGRPYAWNQDNFRRLMRSRRFRQWFLDKANHLEMARKRAQEGSSKNF